MGKLGQKVGELKLPVEELGRWGSLDGGGLGSDGGVGGTIAFSPLYGYLVLW